MLAPYQPVSVLSDEFCNFMSFDIFIKHNTIRFTCFYVSPSSAASPEKTQDVCQYLLGVLDLYRYSLLNFFKKLSIFQNKSVKIIGGGSC